MMPASINNESRLADASSAEVTNDPVISVDSSEVALTATVKTDSEKNDPVDAVRTLHKDHGRTIHGTSQIACLPHMEGRRLWLLITVLCVGLLLSTLETTIVATALISISSELEDYGRSNWIVASYLLTYTGFLVIFARWSDIFGRRSTYLVALLIFTVFSLGCGLAQTMTQLIVLRVFQGIGGAGLYSLSMGVATEVPGKLRGPIGGLLAMIFAISSVAGPPIGGAITSNTSWRWVFLFNVPVGAVLFAVSFVIFPRNPFPLQIDRNSLLRIDWPGIVLSLGAMTTLLFALEEGGVHHEWDSAPIVACLVVQGVLWVAFAVWETLLTHHGKTLRMLPIIPSRLFARRVICCTMITAFMLGIPFMTAVIYLPQRFQLQNSYSPADAGVRMLPLLLLSSVAAGVGGFIVQIKNVSFYLLVVSACLQLLGLGLMSSLPASMGSVPARQYGYQIILGVGFGLSLSTLPLVARLEVEKEDHAVSMGAITQIRVLGGLIGIAVSQTILNDRVRSKLVEILNPEQLSSLMASVRSLDGFSASQVQQIRDAYGNGFNLQFRVMLYIGIACLLITLGCWIRNPLDVQARERVEEANRKARLQREQAEKKLETGSGSSDTENSSDTMDGKKWAINE